MVWGKRERGGGGYEGFFVRDIYVEIHEKGGYISDRRESWGEGGGLSVTEGGGVKGRWWWG